MRKLSIEEKNKRFHAMSDRKKRVAIAKDVIQQLNSKTYVPTQSVWAEMRFPSANIFSDTEQLEQTSVQDLLQTENAECCVCGVGALIASAVNLGNNCLVKESADVTTFRRSITLTMGSNRGLLDCFSAEQIRLIELAFEVGNGAYRPRDYFEDRAVLFGERYKTLKGRMLGIMQNIIKNNGEFKP